MGRINTSPRCTSYRYEAQGTNAEPERPTLTSLIRPQDPPILMAFAQELDNWPALNQFLDETFGENR